MAQDRDDRDRRPGGRQDQGQGMEGSPDARRGDLTGAGQSGGGAYPNPHSGHGGGQGGGHYGGHHGGFTGGQSNQGYYGGGQMGDRNYGSGGHMAAGTQGGQQGPWGLSEQRHFSQHGNRQAGQWHDPGHGGWSGQGSMGGHGELGGWDAGTHHESQGWRDQPTGQSDRDYEEFRRYRQERFNAEFDEWRKNRQGQGGQSPGNDARNAVLGARGREDERNAPGISTDKKSDDTKP